MMAGLRWYFIVEGCIRRQANANYPSEITEMLAMGVMYRSTSGADTCQMSSYCP